VEERYLTGEQHRALMRQQRPPQPPERKRTPWLPWLIVIAVMLLAAAFFGGMEYQKLRSEATTDTPASSNGGTFSSGNEGLSGGPSTCQGSNCSGPQSRTGFSSPPVIGKVTAISSTSITIQPSSGDAKAFSITGSTKELAGPGTDPKPYQAGDVKAGDSVGVAATSSNSQQADLILLNMQNMQTQTDGQPPTN
jgi:hypothetical protein